MSKKMSSSSSSKRKLHLERSISIPHPFRCPISLELMRDPVTLCTGITYDRGSIDKWLETMSPRVATCPASMQRLWSLDLVPNHTLRRLIQEWCVANRSSGIERIPTPKPPLDERRANLLLEMLLSSTGSRGSVLKILRNLARDSERNRRILASAGAFGTLQRTLCEISSSPENLGPVEDVLAILALIIGAEDVVFVDDPVVLDAVSWVLTSGSCEGKVNAALFVESICNKQHETATLEDLAAGLVSGIVDLTRDRLCKRAVRSGLKTLYAVSSRSRKNSIAVVEAGAVPVLLELLPEEASKKNAELVLGILEILCGCSQGRSALVSHALAIPLLVGNILAVSDRATEHAVGSLWMVLMMCDGKQDNKAAVVDESIRVGAFNQLLLLMQADTSQTTKIRARDLLKLLKHAWSRHPCAPPLAVLL